MIEDLSVDDRARALVVWASRWDEFGSSLGCDPLFTNDRIVDLLTAAASHLAHPMLSRDVLLDRMLDLRNAVHAKTNYEVQGFVPDHLDDKIGDTYDRDQVLDLLDDDVDDALFPLLTACSIACHECRRTKRDVIFWQPATYGLRCDDHRLIVATHDGMGVGLVAS